MSTHIETAPRNRPLSGFPPAGNGDFSRLATETALPIQVVRDVYDGNCRLDANAWCRLARAATRLGLALPRRGGV
jgi:hypothetical protein